MDLILVDRNHSNRKYYIQDYIGKKFGRLEVLGRVPLTGNPTWRCECECGNLTNIAVASLLSDTSRSCGCLAIDSATIHGLSNHPMYNTWVHMIHRCKDPDNENYFQQGIRVCKAWKTVEVFIAWCEVSGYSYGLELDRKINEKGYSPDNCRFTTRAGNNQNRRKFNCNPSGYTGVRAVCNGWLSEINNQRLGTFDTKEQALKERNEFIVTNKLLNPIQTYVGE